MVKARDIDTFITSLAPVEFSESWDNDGIMVCANPNVRVSRAVVCLEVNVDAIKYAIKTGANLIITHHPFIFRAIRSVSGEKYSEIELLIKNNISVLSYHTRYDKAKGGVNDALAESLGLKNVIDMGTFLRVGELECQMSGEEFAEYLRRKLGCGVMKAYFEKNAKIKKVAVCGGAGKDFLCEASEVADAYVSSDFSHETFREAKVHGIAVFDAGHYFTENPGAKKLQEMLQQQFRDIEIDFYDVGSPFFTV